MGHLLRWAVQNLSSTSEHYNSGAMSPNQITQITLRLYAFSRPLRALAVRYQHKTCFNGSWGCENRKRAKHGNQMVDMVDTSPSVCNAPPE